MASSKVLLPLLLALSACLPKPGVLILAHGGSPEWNALVEQAVAPLRERLPVEIAYGMADPETVRAAVLALEERGAGRIVAVPLFMAGDAFKMRYDAVFSDLREGAVSRAGEGGHPTVVSRVSDGLLDSSLAGRILLDRARALSRRPQRESVLVLAHGPGPDEENARWLARLDRLVRPLGRLGFREVRVETLREDWPRRREEATTRIRAFVEEAGADGEVLVIPFRVAGFGPYAEVLEGLDYVADGRGLAPHPLLTAWIRRQALGCLAECTWEQGPAADRSP